MKNLGSYAMIFAFFCMCSCNAQDKKKAVYSKDVALYKNKNGSYSFDAQIVNYTDRPIFIRGHFKKSNPKKFVVYLLDVKSFQIWKKPWEDQISTDEIIILGSYEPPKKKILIKSGSQISVELDFPLNVGESWLRRTSGVEIYMNYFFDKNTNKHGKMSIYKGLFKWDQREKGGGNSQ